MPKVSVIMPAYNAEQYISEAIDSILAQTFTDFEFIIINDSSLDSTEQIVMSYGDKRISYVKNEQNLGVAKTLNKGLAMAKGQYVARMDADDVSLPSRLGKQVAYMDAHPECGICGTNTLLFGQGKVNEPFCFAENDKDIRADILFNNCFAHPTVMLRTQVIRKYHLEYDSSFERIEDYELWGRLLMVSKGHNIQEPLLRYRFHASQVTQAYKPEQLLALQKLHRIILLRVGVDMTPEEEAIFNRICAGERQLSQAEYKEFVSGGRKLIACCGRIRTRVRKIYSSVNMQIMKASDIQVYHFSVLELAYQLLDLVRNSIKK